MNKETLTNVNNSTSDPDGAMVQVLLKAGYSEKAVEYYLEKPFLGMLSDADIVADMTGTCGDSMIIYIKETDGVIVETKFQVMGCAGAIASAMAVADIVTGKSFEEAKTVNDGTVFSKLETMPAEKHECIQLAVKTLHKALEIKENQ